MTGTSWRTPRETLAGEVAGDPGSSQQESASSVCACIAHIKRSSRVVTEPIFVRKVEVLQEKFWARLFKEFHREGSQGKRVSFRETISARLTEKVRIFLVEESN